MILREYYDPKSVCQVTAYWHKKRRTFVVIIYNVEPENERVIFDSSLEKFWDQRYSLSITDMIDFLCEYGVTTPAFFFQDLLKDKRRKKEIDRTIVYKCDYSYLYN